ncbi:MAG: biopolymer transporter ExbD, partial [Bacteroidota bacterium]
YLENMSSNTTENSVEKAEKRIHVQVDENLTIFIDGIEIDAIQLEEQLKMQFDGHANPVVVLETKAKVSSKSTLKIMEIAAKNNYNIILESNTK